MRITKIKKNHFAITAKKEDIAKRSTTLYKQIAQRVGKIKTVTVIRDSDEAYSNGLWKQIKNIKVNYNTNSLILITTR